jgi:Tfp pilus assembly protein PilF
LEFGVGRFRTAKKYFERALRVPMDETARAATLSNAGQACLALGENRQAEQYYRDAIQIMPQAGGLWHRVGQAMFAQGRRPEAEAAYRRALQLDNRDTDVWNDLAAVLEASNRREEAIVLLREAVAASPVGQNRARILRNLGVLEWKTGDRSTAVIHLQEALTQMEAAVGGEHPDVGLLLQDYSDVLAKTGDKAGSREAAKRAESIRSAFAGQDGAATVDWRELRK